MITTFFIAVFMFFLTPILKLLPIFNGFPPQVQTALDFVHTNLAGINKLFPLDTLLTILSLVLTIETVYFTFRISIWIYNKIRGSG